MKNAIRTMRWDTFRSPRKRRRFQERPYVWEDNRLGFPVWGSWREGAHIRFPRRTEVFCGLEPFERRFRVRPLPATYPDFYYNLTAGTPYGIFGRPYRSHRPWRERTRRKRKT